LALWDEYYFNFHSNTTEDIIIEIKNEGDADLIFDLPLVINEGSFGPLRIMEQPDTNELAPGEETHFIVRHTAGNEYIHSAAKITIHSNYPDQSTCDVLLEVVIAACGFATIYVDSSATGANNGTSWTNAFTKLQDALSIANVCHFDTILVARGTYYPDEGIGKSNNDRTISFNIPDSTMVLGGFPSGGGTFNERNLQCNKTILSGISITTVIP
jgi:hypothetical protein